MATQILLKRGIFPKNSTSAHLEEGEIGYNLDHSSEFPEIYGHNGTEDFSDALVNPIIQLTNNKADSLDFLSEFTDNTITGSGVSTDYATTFIEQNNGITSLGSNYNGNLFLTPNTILLRGNSLYCTASVVQSGYRVERVGPSNSNAKYKYYKDSAEGNENGNDYYYFEVPVVNSPTHFMIELEDSGTENSALPFVLFYTYNTTDAPRKVSIVNSVEIIPIKLYCVSYNTGIGSKVYDNIHTLTIKNGTFDGVSHTYASAPSAANLSTVFDDSGALSTTISDIKTLISIDEEYWSNNISGGGSIYLTCTMYPVSNGGGK